MHGRDIPVAAFLIRASLRRLRSVLDIRRETFVIDTGTRDNRVVSLPCSAKANRNRGPEGDPSDVIGLAVDFSFTGITGNAPAQGVTIDSFDMSPAESWMEDVACKPVICRGEVARWQA